MSGKHLSRFERSLSFLILGQRVRVECADKAILALLYSNFEAMVVPNDVANFDVRYWIRTRETRPSFALIRNGHPALDCEDLGEVLFFLERDMTVELQKRRADLFFLHSASVEWRGKACLLTAESGSGKSTTTWGLLYHGFRYLSDELSPIDLESMRVLPYPHALNLKQSPPGRYPLPKEAIHLGRTIHVPVRHLPEATISRSLPLGAVFLLAHRPELTAPEVRALGQAEASARLYVNALNALAHPNHGLDAVVRIAEQVPCFSIASTELAMTCAVISATMEQVVA